MSSYYNFLPSKVYCKIQLFKPDLNCFIGYLSHLKYIKNNNYGYKKDDVLPGKYEK